MNLTARSSHFDFGKNWADYSALIDAERLAAAAKSVDSLVPNIAGKTFLDIGSGSGLFSLAALRLGAGRVLAIDIDEDSVSTTRKVLSACEGDWSVECTSALDISPDELGTFDVVYSWGVLHHTGDMWRAVEQASRMVSDDGLFVFALYERTPLCGIWRAEKRFYANASPRLQRAFRAAYKSAFRLASVVSGRGRKKRRRGMELDHDVHDWLGGYPYESTNRIEVSAKMSALGFEPVAIHPAPVHLWGAFGSGCSEYVYHRATPPRPSEPRN
jgi:2-polyprenyl-3-methyl-5-hydroxy-6-metoxy-1,4-benzoquinol methylase